MPRVGEIAPSFVMIENTMTIFEEGGNAKTSEIHAQSKKAPTSMRGGSLCAGVQSFPPTAPTSPQGANCALLGKPLDDKLDDNPVTTGSPTRRTLRRPPAQGAPTLHPAWSAPRDKHPVRRSCLYHTQYRCRSYVVWVRLLKGVLPSAPP